MAWESRDEKVGKGTEGVWWRVLRLEENVLVLSYKLSSLFLSFFSSSLGLLTRWVNSSPLNSIGIPCTTEQPFRN